MFMKRVQCYVCSDPLEDAIGPVSVCCALTEAGQCDRLETAEPDKTLYYTDVCSSSTHLFIYLISRRNNILLFKYNVFLGLQ